MVEPIKPSAIAVVPSTGADGHFGSQVACRVDSDDVLVRVWLQASTESGLTRKAYFRDAHAFLRGASVRDLSMADLVAYAEGLDGAPATRRRKLATVKSLLSFAHKIGYTPVNIGAAYRLPKVPDTLAERILTEDDMRSILEHAESARDRALLLVLYTTGARAHEASQIDWGHLAARGDDAGQVTLYAKGDKSTTVLLPPVAWLAVGAIRPLRAVRSDPVFRSLRTNRRLGDDGVRGVVSRTAARAGFEGVTPHWFRHAHATHAIDRGAPISLVRDTLGHRSIRTTQRYLHVRPGASSGSYLELEKRKP